MARTTYQRRRNRKTGTHIIVCEADEGEVEEGIPWMTICDEHGSCVCHETLKLAREWASLPDWCEECQELMRRGEKYVAPEKDEDDMQYEVGSKVMFRGEFAKEATVRGEVEDIREGEKPFGVRLENGNFSWAGSDQLDQLEERAR
jgi:hypothetical protein